MANPTPGSPGSIHEPAGAIPDGPGVMQGVIQHVAEVERREAAELVVSTPRGIRRARTALSCLVQPVPGDTVLLAWHDEAVFVLSVLARTGAEPLGLEFGRDTQLQVHGSLALQATQALRLQAPEVALSAQRLSIVVRACEMVADALDCTARLVRQWSDVWSVRARAHDRRTEELEMVRAGSLDVDVQDVAQLRSTHTVMKSRELTKIDGRQIQVG